MVIGILYLILPQHISCYSLLWMCQRNIVMVSELQISVMIISN